MSSTPTTDRRRTARTTVSLWTCRQCERTYNVPPRSCRHCGGTSFRPK